MGFDEERGRLFSVQSLFVLHNSTRVICIAAYEKLVAEYENLRKAILEDNVNITKRIINDLNIDQEIVVNFSPKEENSLLFM